jgi:hypothetical protein
MAVPLAQDRDPEHERAGVLVLRPPRLRAARHPPGMYAAFPEELQLLWYYDL